MEAKIEEKKKTVIRPSELPIYGNVRCHSCDAVKQAESVAAGDLTRKLEEDIGRGRRMVIESLGAITGSTDRLQEFYETGKAHTLDSIAYVREESNILARVGVISFGGLTGILFGARGGFLKKLVYSSVGASAVASLCYPKEASQLTKRSYTIAKYYAYTAYNRVKDEVQVRSTKLSTSDKKETSQQQKNRVTVGDYGQSKPEDGDMYTTRGSS